MIALLAFLMQFKHNYIKIMKPQILPKIIKMQAQYIAYVFLKSGGAIA
jgi:hypothetical protein